MTREWVVLPIFAVAVFWAALHFQDFVQLNNAVLLTCAVIMVAYRDYENVASFAILIALNKLVEVVVLHFWFDSMSAYTLSLFYIFIDYAFIKALYFRPIIFRKLDRLVTGSTHRNRFFLSRSDLTLVAVYKLNLWINIIYLLEHVLRHTDDFGLPQSVWLYEHARVVYYNFKYLKIFTYVLEMSAVMMSIGHYFREPKLIKA